MDSDQSLAVSG